MGNDHPEPRATGMGIVSFQAADTGRGLAVLLLRGLPGQAVYGSSSRCPAGSRYLESRALRCRAGRLRGVAMSATMRGDGARI